MRRMSRFVLSGALALGTAVGALVAVADGSAAAQSDGNGLEEVSVNRFFIDPTAGVVKVEVEITIRNVTSDTTSGNVITRTFFNGYGIVVPAGAENIVATQNGRTLNGERLTDGPNEAFAFYRFDLAGRVFNGESARITVTYDHAGLPPRSEIPWRANSAYTSYVAFGLGDTGSVTIEILQPAGYEFDEFTDLSDFVASAPNDFGVVTHTRSGLDEEFSLVVGLSNDDRLVSTPLGVDGVDLVIRSWPGDDEWLEFATSKVESGLPELEELIGSPWPPDGDFDIRQTVEPNLYGYAGWFDSDASEIAVGEELDADTLYHELAHAWFNGDVFRGRWLGEGFAQVYASEMVARDGDEPLEPDVPTRFGTGSQALSEWTTVDDNATATFEAQEDYGYNAAFWVVQEMADEIGFAALADVIATAEAGATAYPVPGEHPATRTTSPVDWRYMLDYLERIGGATEAEVVFRDYVVPEEQFDDLDARRAAIDAYDALAVAAAPWIMPVELRDQMDRWAFGRAGEVADAASAVLDLRSELEELSMSTGIAAVSLDTAATAFVDADDDFVALSTQLDEDIAAAVYLIDQQGIVAEKATATDTAPPRPRHRSRRESRRIRRRRRGGKRSDRGARRTRRFDRRRRVRAQLFATHRSVRARTARRHRGGAQRDRVRRQRTGSCPPGHGGRHDRRCRRCRAEPHHRHHHRCSGCSAPADRSRRAAGSSASAHAPRGCRDRGRVRRRRRRNCRRRWRVRRGAHRSR